MNTLKEKFSIIALIFSMLSISASPNPIMLISVYIIHEAGHIFFARLTGAKIKKMRGGVFHLSISYSTEALSYKKEALVCLGGIIFNLLFALFTFFINVQKNDTLSTFSLLNASLALMNLYPVSILDGGGILKSLLLIKTREDVAEKICLIVSFVFAIILWLVSVYLQIIFSANVSLFLISVLLLIQLCFSI
ncbi:MAG: site-2 protease family protein [Clostridia bacterium]|nr:site-2 protease family protein [Clostridia bacterium]